MKKEGGIVAEFIESSANQKFKLYKSLVTKKSRDKNSLYLVEGKRMTYEAVEYDKENISSIILSRTYFDELQNDAKNFFDDKDISICVFKDSLFTQIANTVTPQGIAAVMKIGDKDRIEKIKEPKKKVLVLDGVSEPGNLGTIIRTAEAAGIETVYLTKGCVDLYNPKVVRATMGSLFRVPVITGCDIDDIKGLKDKGFKVVASYLGNSENVYDLKKAEKTAIVIGSEAFGVSKDMLEISDAFVHIPMNGKVESLNAAVAAGILMYILN